DVGPHPDHAPLPTTATHQGRAGGLIIGPARRRRSALPVVKTFAVPSLNLKGLAEGMTPKCESQANARGSDRSRDREGAIASPPHGMFGPESRRRGSPAPIPKDGAVLHVHVLFVES